MQKITPKKIHQTPAVQQKDRLEIRSKCRLYNSLTKRKETFEPIEPNKVRMYSCGLTVNYLMHIGHARTYIFWDVVERFMRYLGYDVTHVSNVTDISVDDNILKRVRESNQAFQQLVTRHTRNYYQDRRLLGITDPYTYSIATQHIQEMIEFVQRLLESGYAYEAEDGVYFKIKAFPKYGRLANIDPKKLQSGAGGRVDADEYDKENVADFVLWKRAKPDEPFWYSPWGPGRPGWHIECSAMSKKYLGETIDISGGGEDNIFPHHENSIAQSEAANGKTYVRYWMHVRHLQLDGEKMSKSKGNIMTVRDAVKKFGASVLRLYLLTSHYRKPLVFNEEAIVRTQKQFNKLRQIINRIRSFTYDGDETHQANTHLIVSMQQAKGKFEDALLDDFNTGRSINQLFHFVNLIQSHLESHNTISQETAKELLIFFTEIGMILFGDLFSREINTEIDPVTTELVNLLLHEREHFRRTNQYRKADAIRSKLEKLGFEIADSKAGTQWWMKITG